MKNRFTVQGERFRERGSRFTVEESAAVKNQAAKAQRKGKNISHRVHRAHREGQESLSLARHG